MSGYTYGDTEPTERCPYCSAECHADFVDIGVGYTQCGPFSCDECGASEIGPFDDETRTITAEEHRTGWYGPGQPPSDKANVIDGRVVSHQEMLTTYRAEFTGNSEWEKPGAVEAWRARLRQKNAEAA